MFDKWQAPDRDSPSINIQYAVTMTDQLMALLGMEGLDGYNEEAVRLKTGENVTRPRRWHLMFERMGLLYRINDQTHLTDLGKELLRMSSEDPKTELARKALVTLSRYQLKNPVDEDNESYPDGCDLHPYWAIWKACDALDGNLHWDELNRELMRVLRHADLDPAIDKIRRARMEPGYDPLRGGTANIPLSERCYDNDAPPVGRTGEGQVRDQRTTPWFKRASLGEFVLVSPGAQGNGYCSIRPEFRQLIHEWVSQGPPPWRAFRSKEEWYWFLSGQDVACAARPIKEMVAAICADAVPSGLRVSRDQLLRFIASVSSKRFLILTGLAGSGKTRVAQAFARWITPNEAPKSPFFRGAKIEADRVTYYVNATDALAVEFWNSETEQEATKVVLPVAMIVEWAEYIRKNALTEETRARTIREAVKPNSKYSDQLHSFETHLKAAAFALLRSWGAPTRDKCYELVPVGADWTGNENIVGYPNGLDAEVYVTKPALNLIRHALEPANAKVPHFLILDEMNLSHVERYFADLLSAIESGEKIPLYEGTERMAEEKGVPRSLQLPNNLFIIGTVNVDETTYMFSPKVLDRANVIEFRMEPDELAAFLTSPKAPELEVLDGKGAAFGMDFVEATADKTREVPASVRADYEKEMVLFFNLLRDHNAEFGYRTGYEAARFIHFYKLLGGYQDDNRDWFNGAMDAVIVQKFLPKLHGSRSKLEGLLWALAWACGAERVERNGKDFAAQLREASKAEDEGKFGPELVWEALKAKNAQDPSKAAYYPLSFDKVMRMWRKLVRDQFVSFAEA